MVQEHERAAKEKDEAVTAKMLRMSQEHERETMEMDEAGQAALEQTLSEMELLQKQLDEAVRPHVAQLPIQILKEKSVKSILIIIFPFSLSF